MGDRRFKNVDWSLPVTTAGQIATWDAVKVAVLMDIRDELKRLNALLHCQNFIDIPRRLAQIRSNTAKPRKARA